MDEISNKPIIQHALMPIEDQEPDYNVPELNNTDAASSFEGGKKKGRGIAKATAQSNNRACTSRKILGEAVGSISDITQSTIDTKRRRTEINVVRTPAPRKRVRPCTANIRVARTPVPVKTRKPAGEPENKTKVGK